MAVKRRVQGEPAESRGGYGALRSRTVARLAGVTRRQLGYWHRTGLIQAHPGLRPGRRVT